MVAGLTIVHDRSLQLNKKLRGQTSLVLNYSKTLIVKFKKNDFKGRR